MPPFFRQQYIVRAASSGDDGRHTGVITILRLIIAACEGTVGHHRCAGSGGVNFPRSHPIGPLPQKSEDLNPLRLCKQVVRGSNPLSSTISSRYTAILKRHWFLGYCLLGV